MFLSLPVARLGKADHIRSCAAVEDDMIDEAGVARVAFGPDFGTRKPKISISGVGVINLGSNLIAHLRQPTIPVAQHREPE